MTSGRGPTKPGEFNSAGESHPQVPGAHAAPVLAASLWTALPRWLLSEATPFAKFFYCLVLNTPVWDSPTTDQSFPMPLPYPSVCMRALGDELRSFVVQNSTQ